MTSAGPFQVLRVDCRESFPVLGIDLGHFCPGAGLHQPEGAAMAGREDPRGLVRSFIGAALTILSNIV